MATFESPGMEGADRLEEEKVGIFSDVQGSLAELWKGLSVEDQQRIADAVTEISGGSPADVAFVPEDNASRFNEFMRTYLSEGVSPEAKAAAAAAIRRNLEIGLDG